jgi:outer membrane protein
MIILNRGNAMVLVSLLRHALSCICILYLLLPSAAHSETLDDAWKAAIESDNRLQASRKNTESLRQTFEAAQSSRLPSLFLESSYTVLNESPAAVVHMPNIPLKSLPMSEDKSLSYKTMLTLPVFTSGRISQSIDAATSGLNAAVQDEVKTKADLKLNVAEIYITVLRTKRWVEVAESNVSSLSSHVKDVTSFYDEGMITKNDLLAAQVSLSDARQRLIQAENNLNIAQASYNRLLGRHLDREVSLDDITAEPLSLNIGELTSRALMKRPELISLSEQSEAFRHQAGSVRASSLPQLGIAGGFSYQQNKYQVYEDLWSATVNLRWDFFDGGISRHNANALLQKAEALRNLRDDAASAVALQVRQASLDVEETQKRIQVTKEAMTQADENLRVTRDRYREGVGTNTEVLDAETLRVRSYTNYYNAMYDAVIAKFRLRYAAGDL